MKKNKLAGSIALALTVICFFLTTSYGALASDAVIVTITEDGRITSYFDEYWVVNVDGTLEINNPTDRDLFEVQIRYDLGSLSIVETSDTSYVSPSSLLISRIPANSSVSVSYNIVGITLVDPALIDKGVFYTAITKLTPVIYSDTFGQLQKANLEDESYTGRPGRLISVELKNPTGFQFTINSLRVIKTPTLDPNQVIDEWNLVNSTNPITISPDAIFVRDILDRNSAEGLVYWLVADMFISRVTFIDISNVSRYTQYNLTIPPELLNYTFNETNMSARELLSSPEIFARKFADKQVVTLEEPVTVSLIVNNFDTQLYDFTVTDTLPPGFTFISGEGWSERNGVLTYSGTIGARSASVPSYKAQLSDSSTAGLDFFDASKIDYDGQTVYSDRVRFIRQYLPSQRIYVQKKLSFQGERDVVVHITVQNLGSSTVSDLLLKEYLEDADVFSQMTVMPQEKGLWSIPSLATGETWEVTYYTTRATQFNFLPSLYGVPSSDVMRSLVLDNAVSSAWQRVRTSFVEILGITAPKYC